jgi:periplasmic protein CpxP/Spy
VTRSRLHPIRTCVNSAATPHLAAAIRVYVSVRHVRESDRRALIEEPYLEGSGSYTESEDSITYMQPKLLTLALGGLLTLGSVCAALAQDTPPPSPNAGQDQTQTGAQTEGPNGRGMRMDPDRQLQRLTNELNLTADQQTQIKPLLVERQQKMQALMQDQSSATEDRRTQARSIMESSNNSIKALLNDDQKQKFEAMQERRRRNRPMGGSGTTPPPASDGSTPQPPSSPQPQK